MTYKQFDRQLALLATIFTFLGVILGIIALSTNYWTITRPIEFYHNGTSTVELEHGYEWNGLFKICRNGQSCHFQFQSITFILGVVGIFLLLISGILLALDISKPTNRLFIIPLFIFVANVLLTATLLDYALLQLLNSHSSRAMIASIIFTNTALALSAYVTGRYSITQLVPLANDEIHLLTHKHLTTNGKNKEIIMEST